MWRRTRVACCVRDFICPNCGQHLAFENSVCLNCGSALGFSLEDTALLVIAPGEQSDHGGAVDSNDYQLCANLHLAECNWLVEKGPVPRLCASCMLTRTRPGDNDVKALAAFAAAENAKRRLIAELVDLKLPIIGRDEDPQYGLAFDLLSSEHEKVMTGHHNGVITLDLAEGDDVHREQLRVAMAEPYRTLLGHFRHEFGHYYWDRLIRDNPARLDAFRHRFGDERSDYAGALQRHYGEGASPDWQTNHISAYAASHPWEDWAESFAHYLHITDTLEMVHALNFPLGQLEPAAANALPSGDTAQHSMPSMPEDKPAVEPFERILERWLVLSVACNSINRCMGLPDLYPFVISPGAAGKLAFVHETIATVTQV